ncbi:hypothetical protein [Streptomyces sp. NPDC051909]|uniref:hypothetical protein n=1 Tax=Streptomyces sp. NPDC051909 TaxID=3154944 RepID=UPI003440B1C9
MLSISDSHRCPLLWELLTPDQHPPARPGGHRRHWLGLLSRSDVEPAFADYNTLRAEVDHV